MCTSRRCAGCWGAAAIRTVRGRGYQLTLPPDAAPHTTPQPAPHANAAAPGTEPGNLPRAPWLLIGREAELQTLLQWMARHRAVTVTGPGGVGQATVALAAARVPLLGLHGLRQRLSEP